MGKKIEKQNARSIRKKTAGRYIVNSLILILMVLFLYSGYRVYKIYSVYRENQKVNTEIQKIFHEHEQSIAQVPVQESDSETEENPVQEMQWIDPLKPLKEINPEVVGWIQIEDTVIDYPVLQRDDNEFYLNHDIYGNYTACGSIFMDCRNTVDDGDKNIILYGHRMNDDSMFGELVLFRQQEFFEKHPDFVFITEDTVYRCEVFAIYTTTTEFEYYRTTFAEDGDYLEYLEQCRKQSMYDTDIPITAQDRIITLSTCDSTLDANKGRLVLQAKLVATTTIDS